MTYKAWQGLCLCGEEADFPPGGQPVPAPFAPLIFLVNRNPEVSRGYFAISHLEELYETEGIHSLLPCVAQLPKEALTTLAAFVAQNGASVLNVAFRQAFSFLLAQQNRKHVGFRVTLVGLGDVGGTVLTGLTLLGQELEEIAIYDPNETLCARYELEMNQILSPDGRVMPHVIICPEEKLFDCDLFIFTASRGVPGLDSGVKDVRMAQFEANRQMLLPYAYRARQEHFTGLFCQVSDPVDHLSRSVFLASNQNERGEKDFAGLLPEQVQGFGLGVMAARAAYYAERLGIDFSHGRAYGPHGQELVVANHFGDGYEEETSFTLTKAAREANLQVRKLGFKPYIAPGLSSAAISILRLLRGENHYGAVPLDGVYFGCQSRFTRKGVSLVRERLSSALVQRLEETHRALKEFDVL